MSLLRNAQDGSVNFQKASYTLDGCVKVWTSRVDSCKNDTGKLLSNLTNDTGGNDEEEEGGEDVDGDGEEGGRSQGKKKRVCVELSTLQHYIHSFVDTSTRKHTRQVYRAAAGQETRHRVYRRSTLQKDLCRFRRRRSRGHANEPS